MLLCLRWEMAHWDVVGTGPGLPDDLPPALLEPSGAEPGGEAAEVVAVVGEEEDEGDLTCGRRERSVRGFAISTSLS